MYLDYETYKAMGGTLAEADFTAQESYAGLLLDHWTLNRLKSPQVIDYLKAQGLYESVGRAMYALVGYVPSIQSARSSYASGSEVTSFNNGVNSFSFGGATGSDSITTAERAAYSDVCRLLPVDLISACVAFNGAR